MTTLVEQVAGAKIFKKLNFKSGFNLIHIAKGDEWKTAFTCRYGLFEYMVMPFGLSNAPATFQRYINDFLREYIDRGIVVYIDDIMMYTETLEEHMKLVRWVLERLAEKHLCINLEKSEFHVPEVMFCGYVVGQTGVKMAENKVKEILEWLTPRNKKEVQSFLGFTNFYQWFFMNYSKAVRPMTKLTGERVLWNWTEECTDALETLKRAFAQRPILASFKPDRQKMIETDASDLEIRAVLSQLEPTKKWHPLEYNSWRFQPAELNYDIHDKEMVVIVSYFKEWRHWLIGCPH